MLLDKETTHIIELDGQTIDHVVTGVTTAGQRFVDIIVANGDTYTIIMGVEK